MRERRAALKEIQRKYAGDPQARKQAMAGFSRKTSSTHASPGPPL
jgi:membrane protein insertase Oxa1/YidC/SpoIIIJ